MASATPAIINSVAATIVAQVPAHAAIAPQIINSHVSKLLTDLDAEAIAAAEWASELASKAKGKHQ